MSETKLFFLKFQFFMDALVISLMRIVKVSVFVFVNLLNFGIENYLLFCFVYI